VPNAAQQPETALRGIRVTFGPLPAALLFLGILLAILYPLGRREYTQIVRDLSERRAASAEEAP
jgi:Na+/melibiose symporter-like transporter